MEKKIELDKDGKIIVPFDEFKGKFNLRSHYF